MSGNIKTEFAGNFTADEQDVLQKAAVKIMKNLIAVGKQISKPHYWTDSRDSECLERKMRDNVTINFAKNDADKVELMFKLDNIYDNHTRDNLQVRSQFAAVVSVVVGQYIGAAKNLRREQGEMSWDSYQDHTKITYQDTAQLVMAVNSIEPKENKITLPGSLRQTSR